MTMTNSTCCGCHFQSDYGTSIVTGDGSQSDPYSADQVDPLFNRPVVRAHHEYGQDIPHNTATPIDYTGVIFDTHEMFTLDQDTRLTIPIAGIYLIGVHLSWDIAVAGTPFYKQLDIRLNGVTVLDTQTQIYSSLDDADVSMNYVYFFEVDDYIEIVATQTSGSTENIVGSFQYGGEDAARRFGTWMTYLGKKV